VLSSVLRAKSLMYQNGLSVRSVVCIFIPIIPVTM
jgi:hypothetical protein